MTGILARDSRRTPLTGSAFVRLLAALDDAPAPSSKEAFAPRLSRWFGWTDAIPLSSALDGPAGRIATAPAGAAALAAAGALEREFARAHAALGKLASQAFAPDPEDGFAPYRERYAAWQQVAEASLGPLRRRVRTALADASPAMGKLAAVDAVMEQVVGAQERVLLSSVPRWLERHFERLARAHEAETSSPGARDVQPEPSATAGEGHSARASDHRNPPGAWLERFRQDLLDIQLAELELRLQPVEGLLAALCKSNDGPP